MKNFIEFIAKELVDEPDKVRVEEIKQDNKVLLRLHVAKSDIGKVIGKKGQTAKSIRLLLTAVAAKHNMSGQLEINDLRDETPPENTQT